MCMDRFDIFLLSIIYQKQNFNYKCKKLNTLGKNEKPINTKQI